MGSQKMPVQLDHAPGLEHAAATAQNLVICALLLQDVIP